MIKIGIPLKYSKLEDGRSILYLSERLRRTIQKAGGLIVPIVQSGDFDYIYTRYNEAPDITSSDISLIDSYLDMVDGVIFPGGFKFSKFDRFILDECIKKDKKVLGICLGMQMMSSFGGEFKTYKNKSSINHFQSNDSELIHYVNIDKDSTLYKIFGTDRIKVNSFHKLHIEDTYKYKVIGRSDDGVIEAIELLNSTFNIGVQWHPEISYDFDDNSRKIIDYFIKICGE